MIPVYDDIFECVFSTIRVRAGKPLKNVYLICIKTMADMSNFVSMNDLSFRISKTGNVMLFSRSSRCN